MFTVSLIVMDLLWISQMVFELYVVKHPFLSLRTRYIVIALYVCVLTPYFMDYP